MARKQCQVCGQPATVRVEANLNGRHSTMLLCDDHYRQLVRQQKRTVSPLEALFGSRSGLFEDFLGSDFFRIGDDAPSMAADTDEVVDASFGEPAPAGTGTARRRGSGLASRISEQSEALLQEAARHAAEFGRAEVDTEHLLLALSDSDVVKTILGQFKIKVDDLKRQIESEAKRGDKPFEGWKFFLGRFTFVRHNLILSIAYLKAVRHCSALYADAYSTDIRRLWGRVL